MMQEFKKKANEKMNQAVEVFKKDLSTFRTGRASLSIFDNIRAWFPLIKWLQWEFQNQEQ